MDQQPAITSTQDTDCGCPEPGNGAHVLRRHVLISNSRGLHARAAAKLVAVAERYSACMHVLRDGQVVPACSIMGLMMLAAGTGCFIEIEAEGPEAEPAIEALVALINNRFDEGE